MNRELPRACFFALSALALVQCSPRPASIAAFDRLLAVDSGRWGRMIAPEVARYEDALKELNPHYALGREVSITQPVQRVILCLFAMQKKDGVIVELGAWAGGCALMLAPFLNHRRGYYAVDTFQADTMPDPYVREYLKGRKHFDVFKQNIRPVEDAVVVEKGTTLEIAARWPRDRLIDFLFIDADHSYEGVSSDWKAWSPFVKKGGVIVFHDYFPEAGAAITAIREFVDRHVAPIAGKRLHHVEGLAWYTVD